MACVLAATLGRFVHNGRLLDPGAGIAPRPKTMRTTPAIALALTLVTTAAYPADIPVTGHRLAVIDKSGTGSKDRDKVVFTARDRDAGITKGVGTDVSAISGVLYVAYAGGATAGAFDMPTGVTDEVGWRVNKRDIATFHNLLAPDGLSGTRRATVRPGRALKLVAKALGDDLVLDIASAGPPAGSVFTAYCIDNAGERNCHCSEFLSCDYVVRSTKPAAILKCRAGSVGDPTCRALQPVTLAGATTFDVDFEACQ